MIEKLINTPWSERNDSWEDQFLKALSESNLKLISEDPREGPDGWPYLIAEVGVPDATEPAQKVLKWLSTRGIGLAINVQKESPDYVLTYGMIWSFCETGFFFRRDLAQKSTQVDLRAVDLKQAGPPTEAYLPTYVKNILKEFLTAQGVVQPKVLVMTADGTNYDLAFSLESFRNPPEKEWSGIAEALGWFLPPHYSILLISETGFPPFHTL